MKSYVFGVDVGGTTIKFGLFRADGTLLEKWSLPTRTENCGEHLLPDISIALLGKLEEKGIGVSEVLGAGIGVPGAVLHGCYVEPCVNLAQWGGFDAAAALEALCGFPVGLLNDANAAALGEMAAGGGSGKQNVFFVTLGTGVGGGVILGGKLLPGTHGCGGEIGHLKVKDRETRACGCGKYGCLEQYASASGLTRQAKVLLGSSNEASALRNYETLSCEDIFNCAKAGDAVALRLVDEMSYCLGKALAAVSCVCDPEIIVIGGGVAAAGDILLRGVEKHFRACAFPPAEGTLFALAELGNDAGIYGAAQLILGEA